MVEKGTLSLNGMKRINVHGEWGENGSGESRGDARETIFLSFREWWKKEAFWGLLEGQKR